MLKIKGLKMSKVVYNATLEYAHNTLEFWMYDKDNKPIAFDNALVFHIGRLDGDETKTYSIEGVVDGNHAKFFVKPTKAALYSEGDDLFSYSEPVYEHYFSVKSGANVYIVGKLNLVQA